MHVIRRYFLWLVLLVAIILIGIGFEAGRYSVYRAHPELSGAEEASAILAKVGQLIQLPSNETPTMATINNAASAKVGQPFLVNAENGDILIVYANAAEAILYRPSTDKLIAVGPMENSAPSTATAGTPIPAPTATSSNESASTTSKK